MFLWSEFCQEPGATSIYSRVMHVPREVLAASIAVMSVVGTIAVRGNIGDMYVMGLLGLFMFLGGMFGFSAAPAVLDIVLGRISEEGLTQSMMISQAKGGLIPYFLGRPITVTLIVLTLLSVSWPYLQKRLRKAQKDSRIKTVSRQQQWADRLISLVLLCAFIFYKITGFTSYGAIFPLMVTMFIAIFSLIYFLGSWIPLFRKKADYRIIPGETLIPDVTSFCISLVGIAFYIYILVPFLGFFTSSIVYLFGTIVLIRYFRSDIIRIKSLLIPFAYSLVFSGVIYYIFRHLLHIHLPSGILI
ncbi:MAG: tripartite tricarboxylate transporter TctB family protein [Desulfohalobiaceae bacterium]|nr:tripartite tricarboxylate transporter TctB family protein [Desulfohalobiaceae bacterium]